MKLTLVNSPDNTPFDAEFTTEFVLPSNLYLLICEINTSHWYIQPAPPWDFQVDRYSKYAIKEVQYLMFGFFLYKDEKVFGHLASYLSDWPTINYAFFPKDFAYRHLQIHPILKQNVRYELIDFEGFNKIRRNMGQDEYSLKGYIEKKLDASVDEWQLNLEDETTYFSINDKFNPDNIMTSKGMRIFIEEQVVKNNEKFDY